MNESPKIRILHLRDAPWVCGPGRTIIETGHYLDPYRFDYYIGAFVNKNHEANPFLEGAIQKNLKVFPIAEAGSLDLRVIRQILRLIDDNSIDIVHTHEVRSDVFGLICAKLRHLPIIATAHGWIENDLRGKIYTLIDRKLLHFFDHVIAVSEEVRETILKSGIKDLKITTLHNALVLDDFVSGANNNSLRHELSIGKDTIVVANIGRLSPEKGQVDFLHAAKEVVKHIQKIRFILIGKGPDREKLEKIVNELDLGEWVIFVGFREDMVNIYKSIDLVVQTSYTEGLPNVILEALLMKVPVIATDVGGTKEIIKNEVNGILVSPDFPEGLAAQIIRFASNKDYFNEMASAGSCLIKKEFCFEKRTKKLALLYERIMEHRGRNRIS